MLKYLAIIALATGCVNDSSKDLDPSGAWNMPERLAQDSCGVPPSNLVMNLLVDRELISAPGGFAIGQPLCSEDFCSLDAEVVYATYGYDQGGALITTTTTQELSLIMDNRGDITGGGTQIERWDGGAMEPIICASSVALHGQVNKYADLAHH